MVIVLVVPVLVGTIVAVIQDSVSRAGRNPALTYPIPPSTGYLNDRETIVVGCPKFSSLWRRRYQGQSSGLPIPRRTSRYNRMWWLYDRHWQEKKHPIAGSERGFFVDAVATRNNGDQVNGYRAGGPFSKLLSPPGAAGPASKGSSRERSIEWAGPLWVPFDQHPQG